jgi:hypothetical protein
MSLLHSTCSETGSQLMAQSFTPRFVNSSMYLRRTSFSKHRLVVGPPRAVCGPPAPLETMHEGVGTDEERGTAAFRHVG